MLFNVQPWQLLRMQPLQRAWYEQAALRHRERETERHQAFLDAIGTMLGG